MRNDKENVSVKFSFQLALEVVAFSEELKSSNKNDLASQLFRSGTSIGANIYEAQNAQSKDDFVHKF